jgi:drug/metabolite transporter (DMT)-like permease
VLWGLNDVAINIFSQKLTVLDTALATIVFSLLLAFVQDFSSSSSIFGYHFIKNRKQFGTKILHIRKVMFLLFFAAIFAGPLGMVAGIVGISYAGPIYAGVITSCYPVVALLLAIMFLKEKPTWLKILGIGMSVFAVIFISIAGEHGSGPQVLLGMLFAACAMFGWGAESTLFSLAIQRDNYSDTSLLLAIRQIFSSTSYLICLIFFFIFFHDELARIAHQFFDFKIMIFICVLSAMTSYLAYYNAIKRIGASLGTTFNATFIFWAGIFSVIFGISHITTNFVIWGIVLVVGIYFATKGTVSKKTLY